MQGILLSNLRFHAAFSLHNNKVHIAVIGWTYLLQNKKSTHGWRRRDQMKWKYSDFFGKIWVKFCRRNNKSHRMAPYVIFWGLMISSYLVKIVQSIVRWTFLKNKMCNEHIIPGDIHVIITADVAHFLDIHEKSQNVIEITLNTSIVWCVGRGIVQYRRRATIRSKFKLFWENAFLDIETDVLFNLRNLFHNKMEMPNFLPCHFHEDIPTSARYNEYLYRSLIESNIPRWHLHSDQNNTFTLFGFGTPSFDPLVLKPD